jgi:hypothetical protein
MLDHFDYGISRDQMCKWGIKWDFYAPGSLCCVASERTLYFRWPPSANVDLSVGWCILGVYTENPIRVDDVTESPKLAE